MNTTVKDGFGRGFNYLRISLTDICNLRCRYCLPSGYRKKFGADPDLSVSELKNLVTALAEIGFWKIRLTGGEPSIRKDLLEIIECISDISGVRKIALSTNAFRLKTLAADLKSAGLSALNISVDSLDPKRFHELTGKDILKDVLEGIECALTLGFDAVKVNTVLLNDLEQAEFEDFLAWTKDTPISVRFIELMQTGDNLVFFKQKHIRAKAIVQHLEECGWVEKARKPGDGPARTFTHTNYAGSVGVIAPYSKDFCTSCNRLRITSKGALRLCLFAEGNHSLRHLLQSPDDKSELQATLNALVNQKEVSHFLDHGAVGNMHSFSSIGG